MLFALLIPKIISIHAPRTGSDNASSRRLYPPADFNPRSPHGERLRGIVRSTVDSNFNPRSPHGERPPVSVIRGEHNNFNPRSPHGERLRSCFAGVKMIAFQSTLPARGATGIYRGFISGIIHFNPRSPHGERQLCSISCRNWEQFQSTLPARGATVRISADAYTRLFQSTLPARGATITSCPYPVCANYFNPRSPHGERLGLQSKQLLVDRISIHAPRTGSDRIYNCVCVG